MSEKRETHNELIWKLKSWDFIILESSFSYDENENGWKPNISYWEDWTMNTILRWLTWDRVILKTQEQADDDAESYADDYWEELWREAVHAGNTLEWYYDWIEDAKYDMFDCANDTCRDVTDEDMAYASKMDDEEYEYACYWWWGRCFWDFPDKCDALREDEYEWIKWDNFKLLYDMWKKYEAPMLWLHCKLQPVKVDKNWYDKIYWRDYENNKYARCAIAISKNHPYYNMDLEALWNLIWHEIEDYYYWSEEEVNWWYFPLDAKIQEKTSYHSKWFHFIDKDTKVILFKISKPDWTVREEAEKICLQILNPFYN